MMFNSQKWATKVLFLHYGHDYSLPNTNLAVLVYACCDAEEMCKHMPWRTFVGIAPSANFDGVTISISCNEELYVCVWRLSQLLGHAGQWVATVSYSIGIMGAVCLWGQLTRKVQNWCRNCRFTLALFSILQCNVWLAAWFYECLTCHSDLQD